VSNNDMELAS